MDCKFKDGQECPVEGGCNGQPLALPKGCPANQPGVIRKRCAHCHKGFVSMTGLKPMNGGLVGTCDACGKLNAVIIENATTKV